MDDIDVVLKESGGDNYIFCTEDGIVFEENSNILFVELFQASMSALMEDVQAMQEKIVSIEYLESEEKKILTLETLTPEQTDKAKKIFTDIKNRIKTINSNSKEVVDLYQELSSVNIKDNNNITKPKIDDNSSTKKETNNENTDKLKLNVLSRLIACFVLSLYTYMDVYCMSLFQTLICCSNPEDLFDIYDQLREARNPIKSVESILVILSLSNNKKEKTLLNIVNQRINSIPHWKKRKEAFETFKIVRNRVAHREPLLSIEDFKQKFPDFPEIDKEISKGKEEFEKILNTPHIFLSFAKEFMQKISEIMTIMMIVRAVGSESYTYLALIDRLVFEYLQDNECLPEEIDN